MQPKPGQVGIILAGRYKGRRVVVLAKLPNNLLLVTGPYKLNGVPLRRVNRAYVLLTKTVFDLGTINVEKYDDVFFTRPKVKEGVDKKKKADSYIAEQKNIDGAILPKLSAVQRKYLSSSFSLSRSVRPHLMKF